MNLFRRLGRTRLSLFLPLFAVVAALAFYDPLALLLSAPWLVAVVWLVSRTRLTIDAVPSSAEAARRRLAIR